MRRMAFSLGMVALAAWAAGGNEAAFVGSAFADVYDAFAPLGVLHRAYADFLFYGTPVTVPGQIGAACDGVASLLAWLHLDLVTQTGPQVLLTIPGLARVRADVAAFCDLYANTLVQIENGPSDPGMLKQASEQGMFAGIYALQQGLNLTFEAYWEGLSNEQDAWAFAVAFSLRTCLLKSSLQAPAGNLRDILFGAQDAVSPPPWIPVETAEGILRLIEILEISPDASLSGEALEWAGRIYEFVVEEF